MLNYDEKLNMKSSKRLKGEHILTFPSDYTVIDLETTGLASKHDEIIELSAIKVRNDEITKSFSILVKPESSVPSFIAKLTGISNSMLKDAPAISDVLEKFIEFIADDVILGHNVNFDINFIYDKRQQHFDRIFTNNFIDTLKISRKLALKCQNHKLKTLADYYEIKYGKMHRGLEDCRITFEVYKKLKEYATVKIQEFMEF